VSATVTATTAEVEANEAELADVQRRFEEASARVETMVAELHEIESTLPAQGSVDREVEAELENRIASVSARIDELTAGLSRLDAETSARAEAAATATLELERLLDAGTHRLVEVERVSARATSELERRTPTSVLKSSSTGSSCSSAAQDRRPAKPQAILASYAIFGCSSTGSGCALPRTRRSWLRSQARETSSPDSTT